MALQKSITIENGATGDYIRIGLAPIDWMTREASVHFMLYASEAWRAAHPEAPLCLIAKLRLEGAKFEEWLGEAALAALVDPGADPVRDQLYAAAKVEPLQPGGGLRIDELDLSDAVDLDD